MGQSQGIEVIKSYCEGVEKSLRATVERQNTCTDMRTRHLEARNQAEEDFFRLFLDHSEDYSRPVFLPKGDVNAEEYTTEIIDSAPDLLIAYGCSIIREPLLSAFAGRFLNVHLGLSPYYRGSGTNYWPLVNGEPELVGATFMHIDAGVDTGEVIHQMRARYAHGDTPSSIGNRLIRDMAATYRDVIVCFEALETVPQIPEPKRGAQVYRNKDFTEESVVRLYQRFQDDIVAHYLEESVDLCARVPIVENPALPRRT